MRHMSRKWIVIILENLVYFFILFRFNSSCTTFLTILLAIVLLIFVPFTKYSAKRTGFIALDVFS
jgi:hypothetical protein